MSQIQSFISGMGPNGPILTLTGDDGIPVSPGGGNINILGNNQPNTLGFGFVGGIIAPNTLSIEPLSASVQSNDNVFTTLYSLTIPANRGVLLLARIVGFKSDFTVVSGGNLGAVARNLGAGVTVPKVAGALITDKAVAPYPLARIINVGNDIEIQVAGANIGDVYNWTCHIEYQIQA